MTTELPRIDIAVLAQHLSGEGGTSARRMELHRLADELRSLIGTTYGTRAPEDVLSSASETIHELCELINEFGHNSRHAGSAESSMSDMGDGEEGRTFFLDHSPVRGLGNPIAPPLAMRIEDNNRVVGTCIFGRAYEGPPGHAHGGWIAAVFDELLGLAQALTGTPGMTAKLEINYRRPTPLHRTIRYEGWIDRVEGRKIFTKGAAYLDDTNELLDEGTGLFIAMSIDNLRQVSEAAFGKQEGTAS